ncbi:hypothetical protein SAMN05216360_11381 [Methylobacterium phyllostachyos]|uniref:Uncharacterized protein n=1 Tax=Methylobacterium phyllostachyos TaxID=582672 RepID=A0A1H0FTJ3_9HYPH|nr:hypothetical protein [Methylobacterium phyllostachyos]SDN97809.1 hypothetical protein SAMN05216360_11381 [Methylobacterium phyllostachyos]
MTPFKTQETADRPRSRTGAIGASAEAAHAIVIPFPGPETRRAQRIPRSGEPRGEILLFLGVRYERLAS